MVTKTNIPNINSQISDLQKKLKESQKNLNTSPTAYGGSTKPTTSDINNQTTLERLKKQISSLNDKKLRSQWYGNEEMSNTEDEGTNMGFIGKSLDFISRPLYGMVGATKHFTGQGSDSLFKDLADNIARNKNTFGDVLRTSNVPGKIAAPLGFALDIAMDPINWATMGTSALIPRIGAGAVKGFTTGKGVAKGIGVAAKSNILGKAEVVGRFTPFFRKTGAFAKLGEKAVKSTEAWEGISGVTAADIVRRGSAYSQGWSTVYNKALDATPGAKNFMEHFVYDPVDWVRQARIKDIMQDSLGSKVNLKGAINAAAKGDSIEPFMKEATEEMATKLGKMKKIKPGVPEYATSKKIDIDVSKSGNLYKLDEIEASLVKINDAEIEKRMIESSEDMVKNADDAVSIMKDTTGKYKTADPVENALRLTNEKIGGSNISLEDVAKIVNSGALDQTGVKWYDNMIKGIRDYTIKTDRNIGKIKEVGKTTMDSYEKGMAIFKVAKVAASPSAWTNAVIGNMLMTHMSGASMGPRFLKRLLQSKQVYFGKNSGKASNQMVLMDDLLKHMGGVDGEDIIRKGIAENPTAMRRTFGDMSFIGDPTKGRQGISEVAKELSLRAKDAGITNSALDPKELQAAMAELRMTFDTDTAKLLAPGKSNLANAKQLLKEKGFEGLSEADMGTSMMSELFSSRASAEMFEYIATKAKAKGNAQWKVLDAIFNKMPEGYEKIDQSYKMATFLTATVDGYTTKELKNISRLVDINPEQLRTVLKDEAGKLLTEKRYALPARNAIELAGVMYLNYAAMPSAVKVMRNMPLLGSPFVSFMYGMSLKTGQTLAYNPSAFNKVGFAMKEFGGAASPLEKKSLDSEFYSYLKEPGMARIPFFKDNPIYMNMANMIPYYSLNMFNPTQSNYGNSARETVAKVIQGSPILKDPAGSVLFDYFIQPLILGESIRPRGQFGQPLYTTDASALNKMGYATRTLGEAVVPNITNYLGLLTPEAAAKYIPSYRWRQLAMAKEGKNQLGISGKEGKVSRTARALGATVGVSTTPVNTTFYNKKK